MYEMLVENKELIKILATMAIVLFSGLAIMSAWVFQGKDERKVTGPLYSTLIAVTITTMIGIGANGLVSVGTKFSMAIGLSLYVFILMILFTVSMLCWVSMNYKPTSMKLLNLGVFGK